MPRARDDLRRERARDVRGHALGMGRREDAVGVGEQDERRLLPVRQAVVHLEHRRRGRVVELRRDELGESESPGLCLADGERRVVAADRVLVERGDAGDLHQAAGREVGPDLTHELAEAEPVR